MIGITSGYFFLLLLGGGIIYYALPKKQWIISLVLSLLYYFFASTPWTFLCLLGASTIAFFSTKYIARSYNETHSKKDKGILFLALFLVIGLWLGFAGRDFWITPANAICTMFGREMPFQGSLWAVPMGMGYYTAQVMGYILDCYMGVAKPHNNFFKLLLFVCFFPQLTTGLISRSHQLESLYQPHQLSYDNITHGIQRLMWGLGKKMILADRAGIIVNTIWGNLSAYNGYYHWVALLLYPVQMYCDFSGCMDIVIGAARIFGIKLPENFKNPFFSRNIQEFWQRWHITLGNWAKDYVMYPLLKTPLMIRLSSRCKHKFGKRMGRFIPTALGSLMVWLSMGIWHGGIKHIVGVSIYYWFFLTLGDLLKPAFSKLTDFLKIDTKVFSWHLFQSLRTYLIYGFGAVFFRAGSIKEAVGFIGSLFTMFFNGEYNPWIWVDGSLNHLGLDYKDMTVMICAVLIVLIAESMNERMNKPLITWVAQQNLVFRWGLYILGFFALITFGLYGPDYNAAAFIYGGF